MNARTIFTRPEFTCSDFDEDITDVYGEATGDEDNLCIAYFSATDVEIAKGDLDTEWTTGRHLTGIELQSNEITTWHDREDAIRLMGIEAINRAEFVDYEDV